MLSLPDEDQDNVIEASNATAWYLNDLLSIDNDCIDLVVENIIQKNFC